MTENPIQTNSLVTEANRSPKITRRQFNLLLLGTAAAMTGARLVPAHADGVQMPPPDGLPEFRPATGSGEMSPEQIEASKGYYDAHLKKWVDAAVSRKLVSGIIDGDRISGLWGQPFFDAQGNVNYMVLKVQDPRSNKNGWVMGPVPSVDASTGRVIGYPDLSNKTEDQLMAETLQLKPTVRGASVEFDSTNGTYVQVKEGKVVMRANPLNKWSWVRPDQKTSENPLNKVWTQAEIDGALTNARRYNNANYGVLNEHEIYKGYLLSGVPLSNPRQVNQEGIEYWVTPLATVKDGKNVVIEVASLPWVTFSWNDEAVDYANQRGVGGVRMSDLIAKYMPNWTGQQMLVNINYPEMTTPIPLDTPSAPEYSMFQKMNRTTELVKSNPGLIGLGDKRVGWGGFWYLHRP